MGAPWSELTEVLPTLESKPGQPHQRPATLRIRREPHPSLTVTRHLVVKIAYLLTWPGDERTGVFKKVADQVASWARLGAEVALFVATTPAAQKSWSKAGPARHIEVYGNALESIWVQRPLIRALQAWKPDITYVRTTPRHAVVSRQLNKLPYAVEIQTDDIAESRGLSVPRYVTTLVTRRACLNGARGMVFASRELSERASYQGFSASRMVLANGVDLSRIEPLPPIQDRERSLRFAFMGLPGLPWHGLDQVIELAEIRPAWLFDIIGPGADGMSWPPNVQAHGELTVHEYRPILAQADAAISTLAWFRNGMYEGSPLKSREYFALGLPVIGGYLDTDLPHGADFYLRIPNHEGAAAHRADDIEVFAKSWRGRRIDRQAIHMIDQGAKEKSRLAFLQTLIEIESSG